MGLATSCRKPKKVPGPKIEFEVCLILAHILEKDEWAQIPKFTRQYFWLVLNGPKDFLKGIQIS
jgi:hypothetical protein